MLHKIKIGCLVFLTCFIISCASNEKLDEDQEASVLYSEARDAMDSKDFRKAVTLYSELESRYPFSSYAQQAMFDAAYAYYKGGDSESAIASADRFILLYPRHPSIDYAYYIKGVANFHKNDGMFDKIISADKSLRDAKPYRAAVADFSLLVEQYPDSIYVEDAKAKIATLNGLLAQNELKIARFYAKRSAYVAAMNRANYILQTYADTAVISEAQEILADAKKNMGIE